MKKCRTCGSKFAPTQNQIVKHDFECVKCARKRAAEYRAKRKAEGNPIVGKKMSAEWYRNYCKAYYSIPENRERRNKAMRERYQKKENAIKFMARSMVHHAIERGEIIRGVCEKCGAIKAEAHHSDYTKPLFIVWLCPKHHREAHK